MTIIAKTGKIAMVIKMEEILTYLKLVESFDVRQQGKVLYKLSEVVGITLFAMLCNATDPEEIEVFGEENEGLLREYFELLHGIPSHDTISRALAMVSPHFLQELRNKFNLLLSLNEGQKVRKILGIDGKTQRGNGNGIQKANHIVSCVDDRGFCLSEEIVDDKSNEITAMPKLIDNLNVKGHIITADAMGCQKEFVSKIRRKKADYVLALKGNQGTLHDDVKLYFEDKELLALCDYHKTIEKARGGIEKREYWQTNNIAWLTQRKDWIGLKSIAITRNTITKNGAITIQDRLFISSLEVDAKEIARAIRGHWMVESYHWHLDVTFREDADKTIDKHIAYNLNILRKLALNILKLFDVGRKHISIKKKRYVLSCNPKKYLSLLLES